MTTALYRRYRPESFSELIGQSQVTEPLMAALRADRVNHAYLFSGPRGCGKTTSARILARCLNCAEGAGRVTRGDKARAFAIARAECVEASAAVEIAALCGDAPAGPARVQPTPHAASAQAVLSLLEAALVR